MLGFSYLCIVPKLYQRAHKHFHTVHLAEVMLIFFTPVYSGGPDAHTHVTVTAYISQGR